MNTYLVTLVPLGEVTLTVEANNAEEAVKQAQQLAHEAQHPELAWRPEAIFKET
jgi:hypothetical protein